LSGTLTVPEKGTLVPGVVLIHGSRPLNRNLKIGKHEPFKDLAENLSSNGTAVLVTINEDTENRRVFTNRMI